MTLTAKLDDGTRQELSAVLRDSVPRLRTTNMPAMYDDVTGDITAIQAAIGTPVAGGTVVCPTDTASNVMFFCTGTFVGINCTFEGSLEATGETNWFGIQVARTNAATVEVTTGVLGAQPGYSWEASVNGLKRVRVRATARTSGTQSWRITRGAYATEPIPIIGGAVTVTGTATVTPVTPTPYTLNSAATTNLVAVKASAGTLYSLNLSNNSAGVIYVKLYNKATAPVLASDVPVMVIAVPATSHKDVHLGATGQRFSTGIALATTTGAADTDATAVAAAALKVMAAYV